MSQTPSHGPVPPRHVWFGQNGIARLASMGLRLQHLHQAVERGDEGKQRSATPFHPLQSAGQAMWGDTVAGLRMGLLRDQQGWEIGRTRNYDTCFNLDRKIAIAVVGGDTFTGVVGARDPRVKRKRGPVTRERVNRNFRQAVFEIFEDESPAESDEECATWFLLLHADDEAIYMELSLPILHDSKGLHHRMGRAHRHRPSRDPGWCHTDRS